MHEKVVWGMGSLHSLYSQRPPFRKACKHVLDFPMPMILGASSIHYFHKHQIQTTLKEFLPIPLESFILILSHNVTVEVYHHIQYTTLEDTAIKSQGLSNFPECVRAK